MSNPYFTVNESGVFTVDTSTVKAAVEQAYKNALGEQLNVNDGVQKQLILNDTETVTQFMQDACELLNSTNIFFLKVPHWTRRRAASAITEKQTLIRSFQQH